MKSTELHEGWHCTTCGEHGEGPTSDRAADKHTRTTHHTTRAWTRPKEPRT